MGIINSELDIKLTLKKLDAFLKTNKKHKQPKKDKTPSVI